MICNKCGKEIDNDSKFCQNCGNQLKTDIQQEQQEIVINQGKVVIHSYTGFYIINPPVKIYIGDTLITKLDKGKTFEYPISQTITLTFKCSIRSTEVTVKPNTITDIYLEFDKNTGILKSTCNERIINMANHERVNSNTHSTIDKFDNNISKNTTNSKKNETNVGILISIISIFIAIYFFCCTFNIDIAGIFKGTDVETELSNYVRENYTGYNINTVTMTNYGIAEQSSKNVIYRVQLKFYSSNALGQIFQNSDLIYVMFKDDKPVSWYKPNYALKDTYDSWKASNGWN